MQVRKGFQVGTDFTADLMAYYHVTSLPFLLPHLVHWWDPKTLHISVNFSINGPNIDFGFFLRAKITAFLFWTICMTHWDPLLIKQHFKGDKELNKKKETKWQITQILPKDRGCNKTTGTDHSEQADY